MIFNSWEWYKNDKRDAADCKTLLSKNVLTRLKEEQLKIEIMNRT